MNALLVAALLAAAPGSTLRGVVVYPDRAEVTRVLTLTCGPHATATFAGLPPLADPASFRATVNPGAVEGLRAREEVLREAFAPQLREVETQLLAVQDQLTELASARRRTQTLSTAGDRYSEIAGSLIQREMTSPKPDVKAWGQAYDAALAAKLKAIAEQTAITSRERELQRTRADLQTKQSRLAASAARTERIAEVLVGCASGKSVEVTLTYVVGGAAWEPRYVARADEAGGAVELTTQATVAQRTGEDWSKARITLSTALPRQTVNPPEITPLRITATPREPPNKVLVRREEEVRHADADQQSANGQAEEPSGGEAPMRTVRQGLSVQLIVPDPADVPGDGRPVQLDVAKTKLKATFAFRAAPSQLPFIFRVADVGNTAPFPLLAGPVEAYSARGLVGQHWLERVAQGAPFHLSFGIADGLRVKRTVVEEVKRAAGVFGQNSRFRYRYKLELANHTGRAEKVELAEHLPVSELDDVKVELDAPTTTGYRWEAADGIATWSVALAPAEQKAIDLAFHVDVPSRYQVSE